MLHYVSDVDGVGGRLRRRPSDFRVVEIEDLDVQPVDADPDAYPHLVIRVTLRGWDTNDFARRLSDGLGISRERVSWAGTKDKHALTTQLMSVRGVDPEALPAVRDADVVVVGRSGRAIEFGDLAGNAFEITVTDPEHPENLPAILDEVRNFAGDADRDTEVGDRSTDPNGSIEVGITVGAPNFFGQQRFGSHRPITHEVGLEIVRGDWEAAVMAYVGRSFEDEPEQTRRAREYVAETRDWEGALERFPNRLRYERSMLHALADVTGDPGPAEFRQALEQVPSNLQRMFVHAAQSYAFNLILSERLERGLPFDRPVAGDVVCFSGTTNRRGSANRRGSVHTTPADPSDEGDRPLDATTLLERPDVDRLQRVTDRRVSSVTRHCRRGRAFVTAPLVGTETELSEGEPGDIERAVLDTLDLSPGDFDLPGTFDSTGTRRPILLRTTVAASREPIRISFALPKGSYATTLLRELLKVDPLAMS